MPVRKLLEGEESSNWGFYCYTGFASSPNFIEIQRGGIENCTSMCCVYMEWHDNIRPSSCGCGEIFLVITDRWHG